MSNGAHSALKGRIPSLSPYEERLLKCAADAGMRLTELSASWRSMDSTLFLHHANMIAGNTAAIANRLNDLLQVMEVVMESLEEVARKWRTEGAKPQKLKQSPGKEQT